MSGAQAKEIIETLDRAMTDEQVGEIIKLVLAHGFPAVRRAAMSIQIWEAGKREGGASGPAELIEIVKEVMGDVSR